MIRFYLDPRVVISWEDFINSKPNFSIALDGYVKGPPRFLIQGPYANFNHHEGVARIATRSTCAQVYFYICLGLLDTFQKQGEPNAHVYINDVDQDVCLSCWLLKNSDKLIGLRFENLLFQLILFEDILDASAGAYPINPDSPEIRRQAWIYEPYTKARADGSIYSMTKNEMFLDENLSLPQLAECLGISPHQLSQFLNARLNKNFKIFGYFWSYVINSVDFHRTRFYNRIKKDEFARRTYEIQY